MTKRLGVLFSGGKDSTYAAYLATKEGYEISCLISIAPKNPDSFMFHTPSISKTSVQAAHMGVPLIVRDTKGVKEEELIDLEEAIKEAILKYKIEGVVTGAVESVYQASRVQRICSKLGLECFNPLWQKDQMELLKDLLKEGFKVMIIAVAAYPLDKSYLGRILNGRYIEEMKILAEEYKINPAGEGGETESYVLDCPLFKKPIEVLGHNDSGALNNWRRELSVR